MKTFTSLIFLVAAVNLVLFDVQRPATAMTVIDPTNLVENTLIAERSLQQVNNQIHQLQNEAQGLINDAKNLKRLDFDSVSQLRGNLARTKALIAEANGIAFEVKQLDANFARLYPATYGNTVSGDQMVRDARERWQQTLDSLHTTLRIQAQVSQNLEADEGVLADVVAQSQAAEGSLATMQATNQLLALQAKQTIQSQQMQITQDRAAALELARQTASAERARETRKRFVGSGTPYTAKPVHFYGQ